VKPVLLLDIDGVLNLFPGWWDGTPVTRPVSPARARVGEHLYGLQIPTDAPDLLDQLDEHFDLRWYTMWNQNAWRFAEAAGLRQRFGHYTCSYESGKNVLMAWADGDEDEYDTLTRLLWTPKTPLIPGYLGSRPFVWIDDDTTLHDDMWLSAQPNIGDFLLITTEPHEGMTQKHVDNAIAWAQSLVLREEKVS
jgi:hypothetical protein